MFVSVRDIASLGTIGLFLTAIFTWGEFLKFVA